MMKQSLKTGFSFGLPSGVITTLGLMIGLRAGTHSRRAVTGVIVPIAGAPVVPHVQTLKILAGRTVEKMRSVRRKIPSRKEAGDEVRTLWWTDGA